VIAGPLISVLFQRGAFDATDTTNTALALAVYGAGLPAFVLQKVLQPLYYAREDTRRPFHYALISMAVNLAVAVGLLPFLGFMAAALGTTVAGWIMVIQLWIGSRGMGEASHTDARLRARIPRILAASLVMGVILWVSAGQLAPALSMSGLRYLALAGLVAVGIISYFGFGAVFGAFRMSDFRSALQRKKG
jgi:putative peptidoglycan lipid II flippase